MLPVNNSIDAMTYFEVTPAPTLTYRLNFDRELISGTVDKTEAVAQAVKKLLLTEKYVYAIYGWDYGIQTADLYGLPISYVESELKRRIIQELSHDDRITDVFDFVYDSVGSKVSVSFTVSTIFGTEFKESKEVSIK